MKEWIKNNKHIIVFVLYAIITFTLIFFHENWRDEAQAWLMARDCNILELFKAMQYEGHFVVWYLLLMPFAKLGFPYITTNIISWIITCVSVWLILKKAPFKFYKTVMIVFLFPFIYLYPVVSRCYALIPLAVVLLCIFYKDRKEKPFRYLISIVLLINTHVIMLGMAGVLLLEFLIQLILDWKNKSPSANKKSLFGLIITIILALVSILPLFGSLMTNKEVGVEGNIFSKILKALLYCPYVLVVQMYDYIASSIFVVGIIVFAIILILFLDIKANKIQYLKIFTCIYWQCFIYAFVYEYPSLQRAASIIFIVLFFKWTGANKKSVEKISKIEQRIVSVACMILMFFNILNGVLNISFYDLTMSYSNAYQIGNYINENIDGGSIMLSGARVEFVTGIIPYVSNDIDFYHIQGQRYFSYTVWDETNQIEIKKEDIENLTNIFEESQKLYYIYCIDKFHIQEPVDGIYEIDVINFYVDLGVFKEIYATNMTSLNLENYILYEVDLGKLNNR